MIKNLKSLHEALFSLGLYSQSNEVNALMMKLADSRSRIIQLLHFSPESANYLHKTYGKHAFLIGKWTHEANFGVGNIDSSIEEKLKSYGDISGIKSLRTLKDLNEILEAVKELYALPEIERKDFWNSSSVAKKYDLRWWTKEKPDPYFSHPLSDRSLRYVIDELRSNIEKFFSYINNFDIVKAAREGKVNLDEYKRLTLQEAEEKYQEKLVAEGFPTILEINGWRWVNLGRSCRWIGKEMKNCGSAGVMAGSEERTILALLDDQNKPHAILTWSPDIGLITGLEGKKGDQLNVKYLPYVRELIRYLKVAKDSTPIDVGTRKFKDLEIHNTINSVYRAYINDEIDILKELPVDMWTTYYHVKEADGTEYLYDHNASPHYDRGKTLWRSEFENLSGPEIKEILKSEGKIEKGYLL